MKTNPFLFFIAILIVVSSCSTYSEYDESSFPTRVWQSEQTIEFKPTIEDNSKSYQLGLGIRHMYGIKNSKINITVQSISPSGTTEVKNYDLLIKDEDGDYISSCAGDLCDLETFVNSDFSFKETGEYTFILSHNERAKIPGVMAIGLVIDEN